MFTIETLWKSEQLKPLQKVYEANARDRRLVVIPDNTQPSGVNLAETVALHGWLEKQGYQHIPETWETEDLDTLDIVHVSKLTISILRRDPFTATPSPLTPNSWLNNLPQERFDALLLAQEQGDVSRQPTRLEIKDTLKPQLEAEALSSFWSGVVADVQFAQSGRAPINQRQKDVMAAWSAVVKRRHYDPTATQAVAMNEEAFAPPPTTIRRYVWSDDGDMFRWNYRMTALRNWISSRVRDLDELQAIATQILGSTAHIKITGRLSNDAHYFVDEAMKRNKLTELATYFDYVQPDSNPSTFNQSGQVVGGSQINVTVGNASGIAIGHNIVQNISTGGGAFVGGKIVVGGDFVGGDLIMGDKIIRRG